MGRHNKKIRDFLEAQAEDPAFKRYWSRRKNTAHSTQEGDLYRLAAFCDRFGYSPKTLYEARLAEIRSTDPLEWGIIKDQAIQFMRELVEGDTDEWPDATFNWFRLGDDGDLAKPLAPGTAMITKRALAGFFETFGERMELRIKAKDCPQGDSSGARIISPQQLAQACKYPSSAEPYLNVAIALFLKDSGLRRSDVALFTVGDYLDARKHAVFNDYGERFTRFDPARTQKERILAHVHLGPEALNAMDEYLELERGPCDPGEPLFIHGKKGDQIIQMDGHAAGERVKRMIVKGLGDREARGKSSHSIRKLHKTGLEAGGVPESWIKYLQGKAQDVYSIPHELEGADGDTILMDAYMRAYEKIRVYPTDLEALANTREQLTTVKSTLDSVVASNVQLEQKVEALEAKRVEDQKYDQALRLVWSTPKGRQLLEELLEALEKRALDE